MRKTVFGTGSWPRVIIISIAIAAFLTVVWFLGYKLRYRFWHLYVHNNLTVFMDKEFRVLLSRYGAFGERASLELKDSVGVIITYPITQSSEYTVQLRLLKHTKSGETNFRAEISSPGQKAHYDTGNPPIYMPISMHSFTVVVEKGLSEEQIGRLIRTAEKVGWESVGVNKTVKLKPPIVLDFYANEQEQN